MLVIVIENAEKPITITSTSTNAIHTSSRVTQNCEPGRKSARARPELAEGFTATLRSRATAEDGSLTQTAKTQRKSKRQAFSRETLASLEYVTERIFQRRMLKRVAPILQYLWCHTGAGQ